MFIVSYIFFQLGLISRVQVQCWTRGTEISRTHFLTFRESSREGPSRSCWEGSGQELGSRPIIKEVIKKCSKGITSLKLYPGIPELKPSGCSKFKFLYVLNSGRQK